MRKMMVVVAALLPLCSGCLATNKACCGWRFEILKPPVIETQGTILVHSGPGLLGAQSLGTVTGPIGEPAQVAPVLMPMPRMQAAPACLPAPRAPRDELPPPRACDPARRPNGDSEKP